MSLSRKFLLYLAIAPFAFGANKDIQELQRDVAMLQDQIRNMQRGFDERSASMLTLIQQTLDAVNRTNTALAVMENRFNDAIKQQQQMVSAPVASVGQKLDQMSEDFRAVRESVLDMNTRMGKLDAKMADLQNLISTIQRPAPPPAPEGSGGLSTGNTGTQPSGPPPGMSAETTYTNAVRDYKGNKYDLAVQEFTDYLKYFSNTQFAPNAQFYIGDIYYRKKDFPNALQAFDAVLEHWSDNNKTPDAHYMKGLVYMAMGRNDSAAKEFRDVYTRYPDAEVAAQAKARLKDLGLTVGGAPASKPRGGKRH
ncbi:MAG TPA: tetratricopeptide repeat protein [Bryobacteraceae bacterium]|nr:tetratricopeptide repeat protein [Bryobacteraceae bacterium]